jgi:myo-inositol-1(or 4)-monophosphatase
LITSLQRPLYICAMIKNTLLQAAEAGARELQRFFNSKFTISQKTGINNPVTEADHASEKAIMAVIRSEYPDHFILSEEAGEMKQQSDYKWIIDPIDGTINFANAIPLCCVSIGVEYRGQLIMGAVLNPLMNELFFAEKGKGATLNGEAIRVSTKSDLSTSCLVTGFPYTYLDSPNGPLQVFDRFIRKGIAVRRLGSAALDLCWTAMGRFEGFYEHCLQPWDSAAGVIILEEAGGRITGFNGEAYTIYQPDILATNSLIHEEMLKMVQGNPNLTIA